MFWLIPALGKIIGAAGGAAAGGAGAAGAAGAGAAGAGAGAAGAAGAAGGLGNLLGGGVGEALSAGGKMGIEAAGHLSKVLGPEIGELLMGAGGPGGAPSPGTGGVPSPGAGGAPAALVPGTGTPGAITPQDLLPGGVAPPTQYPGGGVAPDAPIGPGNRTGLLKKFMETNEKINEALESVPILGHYLKSSAGELQERKLPADLARTNITADQNKYKEMVDFMQAQDAIAAKREATAATLEGSKYRGDKTVEAAGIGAGQRETTEQRKTAMNILKNWGDMGDEERMAARAMMSDMGNPMPEEIDEGGRSIEEWIAAAGDKWGSIKSAWDKAFGGRGKKGGKRPIIGFE